jgi:hypothetical protein
MQVFKVGWSGRVVYQLGESSCALAVFNRWQAGMVAAPVTKKEAVWKLSFRAVFLFGKSFGSVVH